MRRFKLLTGVVILASALSALAQHPRLESGPGSLLSSSPVYGNANGAQRIGTLVPTDEGWMAFWADDIAQGIGIAARRVLATRAFPDGEVCDTTGLHVASYDGYVRFTAIHDPDGARAFWAIPGAGGFALYTATVSDDGEVSPAVVVGEYPGDATGATLAAAVRGTRTAVMLGRYVMIVDDARLVRTIDLGGFGDPQSIVATLSRFVVTWVAAGDILMRQTFDLDGNTLGSAGGTGVASPARLHGLASDGTSVLLAWGDAAGLHLGMIDVVSGQLIETTRLPIGWVWPHSVWSGSSYLVAWYSHEDGAVLGVRVTSAGSLLSAEPVRIYEGDPGYFELAARGSETAMLHQTGGCIRYSCEMDVILAMLGPEATGEHLVSAAARPQTEPAVASDGEGYLAVWREEMKLFAAETTDRSRATSAPFPLADAPGYSSVVANDGATYMAAWVSFREGGYSLDGVALARDDGGLLRSPFSLPASGDTGPFSVSIGAAPGLFLLAWPRDKAREAIRVDSNGVILDSVPIALPSDYYVYMPFSIAFDGDEFVVAWFSVETTVEPSISRVESARVTRGGTARFERTWVTVPGGTIQGASVGCSPVGTCLIVWIEQAAPGEHHWSVRGQRFRTGGSLIDTTPFDIDVADRTQTRPNVLWDGSRFIVVWGKYVGDVTPERLEGRIVPASGTAALAPPDLLGERNVALQSPATACNRRGRCIITGPEFVDDEILGRTWRIVKRFFGEARHRAVRR